MTRSTFQIIIALLTGFFVLSQSACKKEPLDDVNLIVNSDFVKISHSFVFEDAATGEPVGSPGQQVEIVITGPDADQVIDIAGAEGPQFRAVNGFITLGIVPGTTPSEANPLEFIVVIHAAGYVSTSVPITVIGETRELLTVPLVRIENTPEGVESIVDQTARISNGTVETTVTLQTAPAGLGGGTATIEIPEGMVMRDADGNTLNGLLTTTLVYFSHLDEAALEAFPGGLTARVNINGNEEDITFFSAGFVAIEIMDQNGRKAKTFENGTLELKVEIPTETYNPNNNGTVNPGDIIPLWSYDEETGIWSYEEEVAITGPNAGGHLEAKGQLSHLSYWNWDWKGQDVCLKGGKLCLKSNDLPDGTRVTGVISVYSVATGLLLKRTAFFLRIGDCLDFVRVPGNLPVRVVMQDFYGNQIGAITIDNLCVGVHNIFINRGGGGVLFANISVSVAGFCPSQPNVLIRPTLGFWYRNVSRNSPWIGAWIVNGQAVIPNIRIGDTYAVGIYYDGVWVETTRVISTPDPIVLEDLQFTPTVCEFLGF